MHPLVGDLARPLVKVRLERRPALETAAGNRVLLDVTDAALVLPLPTLLVSEGVQFLLSREEWVNVSRR